MRLTPYVNYEDRTIDRNRKLFKNKSVLMTRPNGKCIPYPDLLVLADHLNYQQPAFNVQDTNLEEPDLQARCNYGYPSKPDFKERCSHTSHN